MTLPAILRDLRMPVIAAPMFIASGPELVAAQCKAGIVGAFPALNARPSGMLESWLTQIEAELQAHRAEHPDARIGPIAVNQIVHQSNARLDEDVAVCVRHRVPIVISSLRAPPPAMLGAIHGYGGIVLHDVISVRHARKALDAGVDGLIVVCAGAGGHAGTLSPFALVGEIRRFFDGPLALSGAITTGQAVLAAQVMGADLAYVGTRFLATQEARIVEGYRNALVEAAADDIVYTSYFSGVHGNYLRQSIVAAGFDPTALPQGDKTSMDFASTGDSGSSEAKAWRDIWGAGQGVGQIDDAPPVAEVVERMHREYQAACRRVPVASDVVSAIG